MSVKWTFCFRAELADYSVLSTEHFVIEVEHEYAEEASDIAHGRAWDHACKIFAAEMSEIILEEEV
jgi:predicted membrane chloride channel (bestrophin family)